MTSEGIKRAKEGFGSLRSLLWLCGIIFFAVFLSGEAAEYTVEGLKLACLGILPTTLPTMLVSDLYTAYGKPERLSLPSRAVGLLFGIRESGVRHILLGGLCGFPVGARSVGAAYERGELEKGEAERLVALSSNPSPPFVIGAVGMGMLGSRKMGILLALSLVISTALVGVIFRRKRTFSNIRQDIPRQRYSFIESVRSAADASLILCAFISSFSVLLGFVRKYLTHSPTRALLFSLLEVTSGAEFFARGTELAHPFSLCLLGFTLGFGGISVMLQSATFIKKAGLSMRLYLPMKLTQGVLCGAVIPVLNYLI